MFHVWRSSLRLHSSFQLNPSLSSRGNRRFVRLYRNYQQSRVSLWKPAAFTVLVGSTSVIGSVAYYDSKIHPWSRQQTQESLKLFTRIKQFWKDLEAHNKFFYTLVGINAAIFLSWRIPAAHRILNSYFTAIPTNKATSSLLLCTFSHVELWHFGINMVVLWSFIPAVHSIVGKEMMLPFYVTAGTFAALLSHYSKVSRGTLAVGSLGASGALLAMAALTVLSYPDSSFYLIFFPFVPIPANIAMGGLVVLDVVGLLRGWKLFDHAGHLGGVLFGFVYYKWLNEFLSNKRPLLVRLWRDFKSCVIRRI